MFGKKKQKKWMQEFGAYERSARHELARAMVEELPDSAKKREMLAKIAASEKRGKS